MGSKAPKSVQKQLKRKEEKKRMIENLACVKKANHLKDPLEDLPAFRTFSSKGLTLALECKRVNDLERPIVDWILGLEKTNMEKLYETCDWGWDEEKKNREMTEEAAWYLIAYESDRTPVAFSHFRFDMDYGEKVLYCYEIQLEPHVRRHQLGKFMMQVLELIAFKNCMSKVILTVLKHNKPALDFFSSIKYTLDPTCPEDSFDEKFCYFILSKKNKHLANKS